MPASILSRRSFLATAAAPLIRAAQPRRNILFIAADDLNHCFSAYGHKVVHTPNLDRIARNGVRFDRAYCQFPLCSPSRTSLLTGLAPDTTGVYELQTHFRQNIPDVVTLPQLFQKNDYFAARVGKLYHYGNPGQIGTDGLDDAPSWNLRINPRGIDKDEEPKIINHTPKSGLGSSLSFYSSPAKDEEHTDGIVAAESLRLMDENRNRPWFLGAGFYKPHCPYVAPSKYFDRVPMDRVKLIPFEEWEMNIAPQWAYNTRPANYGLGEKQRLEAMQAYYATILFLDANVGPPPRRARQNEAGRPHLRLLLERPRLPTRRAWPMDETGTLGTLGPHALDAVRRRRQGPRQGLRPHGRVPRSLPHRRRAGRTLRARPPTSTAAAFCLCSTTPPQPGTGLPSPRSGAATRRPDSSTATHCATSATATACGTKAARAKSSTTTRPTLAR